MTTKRIRCGCGRVYDPVKRPACPDCGATNVVAAPLPEPAPERTPEVFHSPSAEPAKKSAAKPFSIPPRLIAIGGAILLVIVLVLVLGRKEEKGKSVVTKVQTSPSPTAAVATATPNESPAVAKQETTATPAPTVAPETPAPTAAKIIPPENDLAAMIADAAPGAKLKVPPGTYPSLIVTRPIQLVGDPNMQVFIKGEGKEALSVKARGVSVQNIQFFCHGIGALPAISVAAGAELQIDASTIQSDTAIGLLAAAKGSIKALGTTFTVPYGAGLRLTEQAKANLTQCSISDTKIGLNLWSGATAELHSCAFERDGGNDGHGSIIALNGPGTSVTADDCHFNSNRAGLIVSQQAAITLTNSTFQENAASVDDGILGLISVRDGGHARLESDRFEANRQGVAVMDGGSVEMQQCTLAGNGLQGRQVVPASLPLLVSGEKSSATVRKTSFTDSAQHAIAAMAGAKLVLEEVDISGSRIAGVILGEGKTAPVHAEIRRSHLNRNGTGLGVLAGSTVEIDDSEFRENNDGIIAIDPGTQLKATRSALSANRNHGLSVSLQANANLVDCDLNQNARGAESGVHNKPAERASITLENCRLGANRVFGAGAALQSELILTNCVFDGTDKMQVYRERGARIQQTNDNAESSPTSPAEAQPSPAADDETSPSPEGETEPSSPSPESSATPSPEKSTPRPRRRPTPRPRPHPPTPEDLRRALRKLLPGGN